MKRIIIIIAAIISLLWAGNAAEAAIVVGRIAHVEGDIYRYMDADDSWVTTQLQSPAGVEDVLATGPESRAEISFPNNLFLRLDENAEIEILELDDGLGVFVLRAGLARFYNRSSSGNMVIETVRGTAKVGPGSVMDMRADGRNVAVSAAWGEATFQSTLNGEERLEVISGTTRLEFRENTVVAETGPISWNWTTWCVAREQVWAQNRVVRSAYLPESMQEYAWEIEPYGSWTRVYYRGYYYWAWKPRHVAAGWSPFTSGYWYDWHGSPVWMDQNPWGWVTHHHGYWIDMNGSWMWTPYVQVSYTPGVTIVGFDIRFGKTYRSYWHPGRVRWISHNDYVGWFPLAPWEAYYGYRNWGPGTVLVYNSPSLSININLSQHRYIDHTVIMPQQHLYGRGGGFAAGYSPVKITHINKTVIVKNYKPLLTAEREWTGGHRGAKSGRNILDHNISEAKRRTPGPSPARKETRGESTPSREKSVSRGDAGNILIRQEKIREQPGTGPVQKSDRQAAAKGHTSEIERERQYAFDQAGQRVMMRTDSQPPVTKRIQEKSPRETGIAARISGVKEAEEKKNTGPARQFPLPGMKKQEKPSQGNNSTANVLSSGGKKEARETPAKKRAGESLQAGKETGGRAVVPQSRISTGRTPAVKPEQSTRVAKRGSQAQDAGKERGNQRVDSATAGKNAVAGAGEKRKAKPQNVQKNVQKEDKGSDRNGSRERSADGQTPGTRWLTTIWNNRGLQ